MPVIPKNLLLIAASGVLSIHAYAETITGNTSDAEVPQYGSISGITSGTINSGYNYTSYTLVAPVFVFRLPTLGAGQSFSSVTLTLSLTSVTAPGGSATLFGLNRTAGSDTVLNPDYSTGATKLQDSFVTIGMPTGQITSTNIASWMNTRYGNGANAGSYIFLRINTPNNTTAVGPYNGYTFASADSGTAPYLTYTTVPEPGTYGLIGAGAFSAAAFVRRRRRKSA